MTLFSFALTVTPSQRWMLAASVAAAAGYTWYRRTRPKPSAEELESARRAKLAESGRLTDGRIIAAPTLTEQQADGLDVNSASASHPQGIQVLIYRYRIAGVTYECAQDVTLLGDHIQDFRIDLPVQVRYDARNPSDSIVVAELWTGLRLHHPAPRVQTSGPSYHAEPVHS